jgi:hypothetical protein
VAPPTEWVRIANQESCGAAIFWAHEEDPFTPIVKGGVVAGGRGTGRAFRPLKPKLLGIDRSHVKSECAREVDGLDPTNEFNCE